MKHRKTLILLVCPWLALALQPTLPAHASAAPNTAAQVPDTAEALVATDLISRVRHAISGYVAACTSHDARALDDMTTSDVRVEYALEEPGTYLSVDSTSLMADCATGLPGAGRKAQLSNLWIFPTRDANAVFIQYDLPATPTGTTSQRQLALVEMRGERISRMLNFGVAPPASVASNISKVATAALCSGQPSVASAKQVTNASSRGATR
jgi:hypothetical protein